MRLALFCYCADRAHAMHTSISVLYMIEVYGGSDLQQSQCDCAAKAAPNWHDKVYIKLTRMSGLTGSGV